MKAASTVSKILYVIMLYCVLFYPPIVIAGFRLYGYQIVRLVAFVYILSNLSSFQRFCTNFSKEVQIILLVILYSILRFAIGGETEMMLRNIIGLFTLLILPYFFIDYGRKIGVYSVEGLSKYLLWATTIAVGISIACFLVPSVDVFFRERVIQYGQLGYKESLEQRGFGWGLYMNSSYSFIIAMMIGIAMFYGKQLKWFSFVIPLAFIACLINARTGVLIGAMSLMSFLFFSGKKIYSMLVLIFGLLVYNNLYQIIEFVGGANDLTYRWLMEGYQEGVDYASGKFQYGTMGILSDQIFFPDNFGGWLFGEGFSLFDKNALHVHSDIGFINQLFYGGLFYCFILYYFVVRMCSRLSKYGHKGISLFIFLTFLIVNFKGDFVFNTPELGLTIMLYYIIMLYEKYNVKNRNDIILVKK